MHHQRDPFEQGAPWFAPPRIGGANSGPNLRPELAEKLEKLDRDALWKADEKGGRGASYDLPNYARIQVQKIYIKYRYNMLKMMNCEDNRRQKITLLSVMCRRLDQTVVWSYWNPIYLRILLKVNCSDSQNAI